MSTISSLSLQQQVLLLQQQKSAASPSGAAPASAGSAAASGSSLVNALTGTGTSGLAAGSLASFINSQELQANGGNQSGASDALTSLLDQEAGIPNTSSTGSGWSAINQSAGATSSVSTDMQTFLSQIGL